jgi:two-component system, probable response regulator PhcQ
MDETRPQEIRSTVLFVDDEPMLLAALKESLRRCPFDILTATSAADALKLLETHAVDVVISDERMPNMPGSEFLGIVRQRHPLAIRIVLTGQASVDAAIRAINKAEVYRYLTKPCSAADLAGTIQSALQLRNLARESARLLARTREQDKVLHDLEDYHPGISDVRRNTRGAIVLEELADVDELIREIERENR